MGAPGSPSAAAASDSFSAAAAECSSVGAADQCLPPKSPPADGKDKQTHIRFLVSNTAAGRVIGKGGSSIVELQSQCGAHIQLSRNYEYFPTTSDRIVMVSGGFDEVMDGLKLILEKLLNEVKENNDDGSKSSVRLIVPHSSCGGIIGKGGSTIKSFIEDSQAVIKISPRYVGFDDRLITVTGSLEEQLRAAFLILSKLTEDGHYSDSKHSLYPYAAGSVMPSLPYKGMLYGMNDNGGEHPINKGAISSPSGSYKGSLLFSIADEFMGLVIGRGGRNLMEISQVTGARIKISERGDFMSGTSNRKVTISGSLKSIHMAEAMIMLKIPSNSD